MGLMILISIGRQIIMKRSIERSIGHPSQRNSFQATTTAVRPQELYDIQAL